MILPHILMGIAQVLNLLLNLVFWLIIVRVFISYVNPDPYNPVVRFLYSSTEPLLAPVRRYVKPLGSLDLSPIVIICIIYFLREALVGSLISMAQRMAVGV